MKVELTLKEIEDIVNAFWEAEGESTISEEENQLMIRLDDILETNIEGYESRCK